MFKTAALVVLSVFVTRAAQAQGSRNLVVTEIAGVPWGTPAEGVRSALGEPDSAVVKGDTTELVYLRREVFGLPARMALRTTTALGLYYGAYDFTEPQCGATYTRLQGEITAAFPRLKRTEPIVISPVRSNDPAAHCQAATFVMTEFYAEPRGPGKLLLASAKSARNGFTVMLMYFSGLESSGRRGGRG